jgi:hypothetical protein
MRLLDLCLSSHKQSLCKCQRDSAKPITDRMKIFKVQIEDFVRLKTRVVSLLRLSGIVMRMANML